MTAWGILGAGEYSIQHILPALNAEAPIVGVASRSAERSSSISSRLGLDIEPTSYDQLINSTEVSHIYVGAPTALHLELTLRALDAGKFVLCEKPFALSSAEAQMALNHPAAVTKLRVGWMYQHHPRWRRFESLLNEGAIGEPHSIYFHYSYRDDGKNLNRQSVSLGGGALALVGCYGVHMGQSIFGGVANSGMSFRQPEDPKAVDNRTSAILTFTTGVAHIEADLDADAGQLLVVCGQEGRMTLDVPVNAQPDSATEIIIHRGEKTFVEAIRPADQFLLQARACIQGDALSRDQLERDTLGHSQCLERLRK